MLPVVTLCAQAAGRAQRGALRQERRSLRPCMHRELLGLGSRRRMGVRIRCSIASWGLKSIALPCPFADRAGFELMVHDVHDEADRARRDRRSRRG